MLPTLTIDVRMWKHSGIGRYLRNVVPLVVPALAGEAHIRLLGERALLDETAQPAAWVGSAEWVETPAPIYSAAEQMLPLRGAYPAKGLLWTPHFNVPLLYRGALVVTMHDIAPVTSPEVFGSMLRRMVGQTLVRRAARQARAILCASRYTADEVQERLGVARKKLTVTYQGLDAEWVATPPPPPHVEDDGVPYVLFVGNIKPNKNLALLLQAFADVAGQVPFRLVLAGRTDGFRTGDAAALALAAQLGQRVRMAGEVSDTTLRALYAGAAAFCLPSRLEGFGLPLLEAMSSGCAVLCSTAGSLPEVAGGAALLFSPELRPGREQLAAALLQVATDEALVRGLQARGRVRSAAFSYTRCASETTTVLRRELAGLRVGGVA